MLWFDDNRSIWQQTGRAVREEAINSSSNSLSVCKGTRSNGATAAVHLPCAWIVWLCTDPTCKPVSGTGDPFAFFGWECH